MKPQSSMMHGCRLENRDICATIVRNLTSLVSAPSARNQPVKFSALKIQHGGSSPI